VSVEAVPDVGHHFTGWSGDTTTSANPLPLTVLRSWSLTGSFAINTYTLDVTVVGEGAVTRTPDQPTYDHGTEVTLRAVAPVGHHFVGWSGDTTTTVDSLVVTATANRSYVATFAINAYTLTTIVVGGGEVTRAPDQPAYDHGTVVTLRATPEVGYHFVGWSGDTATTVDSLVVTATGDRTYTATFEINTYTLAVAGDAHGAVTRTPDQATYDHGQVVVVRAVPEFGYHFTGWSGDTTGTVDSLVVTMTGNRSYAASFEINVYTLTLLQEGSGNASKSPNQPTYLHGTPVTLTATPSAGHSFLYWSGDTSATATTLDIVMTSSRTYTATFSVKLTVTVIGDGTVTKNPDLVFYEPYDLVELTAIAGAGQRFAGWEGDTVTAVNQIEILMDTDKNYIAQFEPAGVVTARTEGGGVPAGIEMETPPAAWRIGESADLGWRTVAAGGLVDLALARSAGGPFTPIATGLDAAGRHRWTVTGPEAPDARLAVRLRLADGTESADTVRVTIVEQIRAFQLGPITPNPARGRTTIPFAIPRDARVRLSIVDVQGREVAVLADGVRPAGRHDVSWDPRAGATSPGVYFVRFEFPGQAIVRRITIAP
jgi:uncharacterized repeat protein (TIGR02543 family)